MASDYSWLLFLGVRYNTSGLAICVPFGIPVLVDGGGGGGGGEGGFSMNSTGQRPVWRHGSGNQNRHPTNSVVINIMIA